MQDLLDKIDKSTLCRVRCHHGWQWPLGKRKGPGRLYGHFRWRGKCSGYLEGAVELGIEYLANFMPFSTENWDRPVYGNRFNGIAC